MRAFFLQVLTAVIPLVAISACVSGETDVRKPAATVEVGAEAVVGSDSSAVSMEPQNYVGDDEVFTFLADGGSWGWEGNCGAYEILFDSDGVYVEVRILEDFGPTMDGNVNGSRFLVYLGHLYLIDGRSGREPVMFRVADASADKIHLISTEGGQWTLENCSD